jgi:Protein ChrB, N-terminal
VTRTPPPAEASLLLGYQLPAEPSRYRVSVWRRLRRIGATPLHRALFVVADSPLNRLRVADMAHDIENWGGHAWVFVATLLSGAASTVAPPRPKGSGRKER